MFKWWFGLLVHRLLVALTVVGRNARRKSLMRLISLIASAYWFAYFLVILPLLGVIEKPLPQPETIEADFDAHYGGSDKATPAE